MDPLFNKAIKASVIFHAALIAALVGNQFIHTLITPDKKPAMVTFIDTRISGSGGGGQQETKVPKQHQVANTPQKKVPKVKKVAKKELPPEPPKEAPKEPPDVPTKKSKIQKSKVKITRAKFQQESGQKTKTAASARPEPMTASEIKNLLGSAAAVNSSDHSPGNGGGSSGKIDDLPSWYYATVRQTMYNAWEQPSRLSIPPGRITSVRVRISPDGRILKRELIIPSGIASLDDSVMQAVNSIKQLKALPSSFRGSYKEITIDFELSGQNI